jgi:transposase-like protein
MTTPRKRLTPDEKDRIIELRLNRVPVRTVAEQISCQTKTVTETWKRWLRETAAERAAELEATREELIQRQDRIAADARIGVLRARRDNDTISEARFLSEERAALREVARLTGADAPARIEHSGTVTVDTTPVKEELLARLARLAPEDPQEQ